MKREYGRVLVAIDGTESSENVLAHARALARIVDVELIVLRVRAKAYSGTATIDLDPNGVISSEAAARQLEADGIRARANASGRRGTAA